MEIDKTQPLKSFLNISIKRFSNRKVPNTYLNEISYFECLNPL